MKAGDSIPDAVLSRSVTGIGLAPGTLRDQLDAEVTLLVFLRHFGCIFCRETLADMRELSEEEPRFPRPLFFFEGTATAGRAFLRRYWPELRAIADPKAEFYEDFGVGRAGVWKALGPPVFRAASRAEAKGHTNGERTGDIWRMPGAFLTSGTEIIWAHEYRHPGDHPDYETICQVASAQSTNAARSCDR